MNGIIGMSGLLLDTPLGSVQRDMALTIQNSGEALLNILNDILDYAKIEDRGLEIESASFDLRRVAEEVVEVLSPKACEEGLELTLRFPPHLPQQLIGDANRIRQVLMNLAGNAIKFTHQGYVSISVAAEDISNENLTLRIEVADTGIGIAPWRIGDVFKKFTQADRTTTRKYGGTGLGLTISRDLVGLMNGAIDVTSEVGVGSRFWFTLPLRIDRSVQDNATSSCVPAGARILLVEHHDQNRIVLQEYLEHAGLRVDCLGSAPEAISSLLDACEAGDPYAIAIIDADAPDEDAEAVVREIRAGAELSATAIVLSRPVIPRGKLVAQRRRDDPRPAAECPTIIKPIRQSQLFDALSQALSSRALQQPLSPLSARSLTGFPAAPRTPQTHPLRASASASRSASRRSAVGDAAARGYQRPAAPVVLVVDDNVP
ncbi:MAG: hypothetical protein LC772_00895, partial [Chloroflexi bacterium]|nr:hypothetical protein [Chloroflexota bacterium]